MKKPSFDRCASPRTEPAFAAPLRIPRGRFWLWAAILTISAAAPSVWSFRQGFADWRAFTVAGIHVGTPALLHPAELWQAFVYLPAAAYAIAPFAHLPIALSFTLDVLVMIACAAVSAIVAATLYRIPKDVAVGLVFAWWPTLYAAAVVGQNATFGLLCAVLTIAGLVNRSVLLTAIPLGILLYKPTYALPLVALLVVRGRLRELGVVCAAGVAWYVLSVLATGGDWLWPKTLAGLIGTYFAQDFGVNARLALGLPGLLVRAGANTAFVAATVALVAIAAVLPLRRAESLEAGSAACLIGLALSPHAWAYDAVLALPMIAYAATHLREPLRTRLIGATYFVAPTLFLTPVFGIDPLVLPVVGGALGWIGLRSRRVDVAGANAERVALHELETIPD